MGFSTPKIPNAPNISGPAYTIPSNRAAQAISRPASETRVGKVVPEKTQKYKEAQEAWAGTHQGQAAYQSLLPWFQQPTTASGVFGDFYPQLSQSLYPNKQSTLADIEAPGALQQMWPAFKGAVQQGMGPENYATQAWQTIEGAKPDLMADPGLGQYYNFAKRRALEDIDAMAASRGAYGSSAALDIGAETVGKLEADRAFREAQYQLDRAGEQRRWEQLGAMAADAAQRGQLNWLGTGADIASGVEGMELQKDTAALAADMGMTSQDLDRMFNTLSASTGVDAGQLAKSMGMMSSAMRAEGMSQQEIQNMFANYLAPLGLMTQAATGMYGSMFGAGDQYLDSIISLMMGGPAQQLQYGMDKANQMSGGLSDLISLGAASGWTPGQWGPGAQ